VFVTGDSQGPGTANDFATLAYDAATGTQRWTARYDGPGSGNDLATALAVAPDGGKVVVTGDRSGGGIAIVSYDSVTGHQRGKATLTSDTSPSLAVSPLGTSLFVTGTIGGGSHVDYGTIAFSLGR
jgi:hypothetical protein